MGVPTAFGHPNWNLHEPMDDPGAGQIGVQAASIGYDKGALPLTGPPTGHHCGDDRLYLDGGQQALDSALEWLPERISTCCAAHQFHILLLESGEAYLTEGDDFIGLENGTQ